MISFNKKFAKRSALGLLGLVLCAALTGCGGSKEAKEDIIYFGAGGPFTGDNAEYGVEWKKGFEIALSEINAKGVAGGRKIQVLFEDTQSDPKKSANVAQKFVRNDKILAALSDFTTNSVWSAAPIYQNAGLVQLAPNPSHPQLTKEGNFIFQLCPTQADQAKALASLATDTLKAKKLAVIYLNTDFGKAVKDNIVKEAKAKGVEVVAEEAYLPTDKDFKAQLTKIKAGNPDVLALGSYYTDGALIAKQARDLGITSQFIASSSVQSPALFKLGGKAVNGLITLSVQNVANPGPTLKNFTAKYKEKFGGKDPDTFATQAYDSIRLLSNAIEKTYAKNKKVTRAGIREELAATKDFPAASQDTITYSATRQLANPQLHPLVAQDGNFIPYTGKK